MYELPTEIIIKGQSVAIREKGDFRMVIDCFLALQDEELTRAERMMAALCIFYDGIDDIEDLDKLPDLEEAVSGMYEFFNCGQEQTVGMRTPHKLIDWDGDSQLITSAINKVAGTEVRLQPYIHWWTFMGYYLAIGESALATVVSIRDKLLKGKKLEKYEETFKNDNPQYFVWDSQTAQQKEDNEYLLTIWNAGKEE